ncbi:MAG: tRNA-uridine aminocarboxypropyltransferase [Candidatus Binatia bacterium]
MSKTEATSFVSGGHIDRTEYRAECYSCRRPRAFCYCSLIEAFDSETRFVIMTQPREAKHRFGTGRMAYRSLRNSLLVEGVDFSADERIDRELHSPGGFPVLLFPGKNSVNLSRQSPEERMALVPAGRRLVVFVLDGTWKSVRKMLRVSQNVARLPMICFEPPSPSSYRIRREPKPHCYSTIEAIHHVLDLFAPCGSSRPAHDNLLAVFRTVIDRQLTYTR